MNLRAVRWLLGSLSLLLALTLLVPAVVSAYAGEEEVVRGFGVSALVAGAVGVCLMIGARDALHTETGRPAFFHREGIATVGLAWILASVIGAVPFLLSGTTSSVADALFESTSGFTTTGATIFTGDQIDALPVGVSFWRVFTHWIGGVGIVVVFVALLPTGGRSLFRSEAREATEARVRDTAIGLLRVYLGLTGAHIVAMWLAGVNLFDSVAHAFSTMATGGFSTHGSSAAAFDSLSVEIVLIVFMVLAGVNFGIWHEFLTRGPKRGFARAWASTELRMYLGLLAGASLILTVVLWFWGGGNGLPGSDLPDYSKFLRCLRDATFSLISVQTCTGYATVDYDQWPDLCRFLLMTMGFIGGSAGSTAGGIKVLRFAIVVRGSLAVVRKFARPRAVVRVSLDGSQLEDATVSAVTRYVALWLMVMISGSLLLTAFNVPLEEAVTGTLASLNNVGPGLGAFGPAGNFAELAAPAKLVLSGLMVAGRLEFFALIALFLPGFWRR